MKTSWSCLGAAAAPAAAPDTACVGVPAALGRPWTAPGPLLGALGPSTTFRDSWMSRGFQVAGSLRVTEFIIYV